MGDFAGSLDDFKKAAPTAPSGDPAELILDAEHLVSSETKESHKALLKLLNNAPANLKEEFITVITKTCNIDTDFAQTSLN